MNKTSNSISRPSIRNPFKKISISSGGGVIIAYVALFIFLSLASEHFCSIENIMNVIRQAVPYAIMGIGMTFVIAMKGIDLSIGAILGACGVVVAVLMQAGVNIYLALLPGILFGFVNGMLITKLKLPEFIATLGMMSIIRGLIMVYTKGVPIYGLRYEAVSYTHLDVYKRQHSLVHLNGIERPAVRIIRDALQNVR